MFKGLDLEHSCFCKQRVEDMNIFLINTDDKKIASQRELVDHLLNNTGVDELSDEKRKEMDTRIMSKLQSGKKLSQKELEYLQRTNPITYAQAMRIQRMTQALEEQLKHAKSKEEVNQIFTNALSRIKNDPDKEYLMASYNRISEEFRKSKMYHNLPDTFEEANRKKKRISPDKNLFEDDEDKNAGDDFDLKNWSPLQEVYDQMSSFEISA